MEHLGHVSHPLMWSNPLIPAFCFPTLIIMSLRCKFEHLIMLSDTYKASWMRHHSWLLTAPNSASCLSQTNTRWLFFFFPFPGWEACQHCRREEGWMDRGEGGGGSGRGAHWRPPLLAKMITSLCLRSPPPPLSFFFLNPLKSLSLHVGLNC